MFIWKAVVDFINDKQYRELLIATTIILVLGAFAFQWIEGWRLLDALYFCVCTLTTIGYGDVVPQTDFGKVFNMFYILLGLGLILGFVNIVGKHLSDTRKKLNSKE
jgi:ABC-type microcin C transport system permease subunit YejB